MRGDIMSKLVNFFANVSLTTGIALLLGPPLARADEHGMYTLDQAYQGKYYFEQSCQNCHDVKFYKPVLQRYSGQSIMYLWETIMGTMPADNPGSLTDEEYMQIIAYILNQNNYPMGNNKLGIDNNLDELIIN